MINVVSGAADTLSPFVLWDNALARATLTASSTAAGSSVLNILGPQTFDYWKPSTLPATVTAVFAAPESVDCVALDAHNLFTSGATVTVSYRATIGGAWVTLGALVAAYDRALALVFPAVTMAELRLQVAGTAGAFIGIAFAGRRVVLPAEVAPPYVTAPNAGRVEVYPSYSMGGQFQGARSRRKGGEMSVRLSPIARAWFEANLAGFRAHYDAGQPFFWASAPAKYSDDLAYVGRAEGAGELRAGYSEGGRYALIGLEVWAYGA